MSTVYRGLSGKGLAEWLADMPGVQLALDEKALLIAERAEKDLIAHKQQGHAQIELAEGDVDRYVVLSDERGQKAAMSIEYGREAGEYEVFNAKTGQMETKAYGAMDGLFILATAANLPKKRKGKVKLPRHTLDVPRGARKKKRPGRVKRK